MKKQTIRITEAQLNALINEAICNELDLNKAKQYAMGGAVGLGLLGGCSAAMSDDPVADAETSRENVEMSNDDIRYQNDFDRAHPNTANFDDYRLDEAIYKAIKKVLG